MGKRVEEAAKSAPETAPVSCAWCGATVDEPPLTWSTSFERGRVVYYCDRCSREHLRSLEAKLDSDFW